MRTLRAPALLLLVSTLLAGTHLTCKKKPTEPPNGGPDTTSHSFTFVLDTLGDGNSSVLNDVAIISENNVWAVGEIYLRDSTGQIDPTRYNLAQWDGTMWRYLRVLFPVCNSSGQEIGTFPFAATSIFAFAANDVWITSLGTVVRWNGQAFQRMCVPPGAAQGSFKKMWGINGRLYLVGTNGNITYFSGSTWQKLESGTTVDIQDIYGAVDARTGETEILAVASYRAAIPQAKKLLRITGTAVTAVNDSGLPLNLSGIWFTTGSQYYVVGAGLYHQSRVGDPWQYEQSLPLDFYKDAIRGNEANDIILSGSSGGLWHYNGANWRAYRNNGAPAIFGRYYRVSIRGDFVVAVGWMDNTAVAVRGRRTQ